MREVLSTYGYDGDNTPIIIGSALCALEDKKPEIGRDSIIKLLEAVDEHIPTPARELDKPFLLPIEDVFSISGRGTVVTGRVERGVIKNGDEVEFVGHGVKAKTTVTGKAYCSYNPGSEMNFWGRLPIGQPSFQIKAPKVKFSCQHKRLLVASCPLSVKCLKLWVLLSSKASGAVWVFLFVMTGTPNLSFSVLLKLNLSTNGLVINLCHLLSRNLSL